VTPERSAHTRSTKRLLLPFDDLARLDAAALGIVLPGSPDWLGE